MVLDKIRSFFGSSENQKSGSEPNESKDSEITIEQLENRIKRLESSLESKTSSNKEEIYEVTKSVENVNEVLNKLFDYLEEFRSNNENDNVIEVLEEHNEAIKMLETRLEGLKTSQNTQKSIVDSKKRSINRPSGRPNILVNDEETMESKAEDAVKGEKLWSKTTPAQKNVLKVLYDSGYPMSYKEIAKELNRTVSTVKNHINNLKSMGVRFREESGKNNSKKYMLDDRVRSFLTMRLND